MTDQTKIVIVNQKSQINQSQFDPLAEEIASMRVTSNLIKQISFNSAVNKFQYLQQLMHKTHDKFAQNLTQCIVSQRQIIKEVKVLNKEVKQIQQVNEVNFQKLNNQITQLLKLKTESDKYKKLSQGMVNAVLKIQSQLDQVIQRKQEKNHKKIHGID